MGSQGANVQLGPGVCLARVPECGRNFEYLSGEDPYLGNQLVQPVVTGIQSQVGSPPLSWVPTRMAVHRGVCVRVAHRASSPRPSTT